MYANGLCLLLIPLIVATKSYILCLFKPSDEIVLFFLLNIYLRIQSVFGLNS